MRLGALAVLALAACGGARVAYRDTVAEELGQHTAPGTKQYGAPGPTLEARPWKLGQWTEYRRRFGQSVGLETIKIIAQDTCGYWIEHEIREKWHRWRWTFCVAQQPAPDEPHLYELLWALIERHDDFVAAVEDFHHGSQDRTQFSFLVELVHAPWAGHGELPREDVSTPDGEFAGAVKTTSKHGAVEITQWSHPEVPLGGLVREVGSDDRERILLQHGTSNPESPFVVEGDERLRLQQRQRQDVRPQIWFGPQFAIASLGKIDEVNGTFGVGFASGAFVSPKLDVVFTFQDTGSAPYSGDPMLEEDLETLQLGVRWMPFGRSSWSWRRIDIRPSSLWVQADAGYAELGRAGKDDTQTSTVGRGAAVGGAIGLVVLQGRDWTYDVELHDHIAVLNSDEGLRHSFGVSTALQLFLF